MIFCFFLNRYVCKSDRVYMSGFLWLWNADKRLISLFMNNFQGGIAIEFLDEFQDCKIKDIPDIRLYSLHLVQIQFIV